MDLWAGRGQGKGKAYKREEKMMGFDLFSFSFEKFIERYNELSFMECSAMFWTDILIRSR